MTPGRWGQRSDLGLLGPGSCKGGKNNCPGPAPGEPRGWGRGAGADTGTGLRAGTRRCPGLPPLPAWRALRPGGAAEGLPRGCRGAAEGLPRGCRGAAEGLPGPPRAAAPLPHGTARLRPAHHGAALPGGYAGPPPRPGPAAAPPTGAAPCAAAGASPRGRAGGGAAPPPVLRAPCSPPHIPPSLRAPSVPPRTPLSFPPSLCPSLHPSPHPSVLPCIPPRTPLSFPASSAHPSVLPSVPPRTRLSFPPSLCPSLRPSVLPSVPPPAPAAAWRGGRASSAAWWKVSTGDHGLWNRGNFYFNGKLKRRELNCYMYAPKDELKHRLLWREPYTEHEAARMQSLIEAAQEQGVEFVFAISAGQDMVFSSAGDRLLLQQKLRQVAAMGCHSFALLFDDIDPCMCQADRDVFPSLAQAQASVANEAYQELGQPSIFLFCPTEYCSSLCSPSPSQSCYLLTLGQELLPGIGVIWTGPKVVSQELSATLLEEVEGVLRRQPVIWDNLYANDYDCRRVFLGPYTGRAPGLMSRLCGLLLNPNCELQANFIPIHTLGSWFQSELGSCAHPDHTGMEITAALGDSQGSQEGTYSPREGTYSPQEALELALLDWVAEINQQASEPGGRALGHPSISLKGGARLQPSTGGQEVVSEPQPHDCVPGGAEQCGPEPCGAAPGQGWRTVTSEPGKGSGSRTSPDGQQSPTGAGDQLTTGSRESCEPSALPSAAGSTQSTTTPVATETLHSPGPAMCCSNRANASQNLPLPTSDARTGGGSPSQPPCSAQPEAGRADMSQTPPGPGAGASPGPTAPLLDGAGASPGSAASLTPEEAGSSTMALLTLEKSGSGPAEPLSAKEARSSPTAPVTSEEARSTPMAPVTPDEARANPTAPVTPDEARSGPTAPVTPDEARSGPIALVTPEEARSNPTAPLTLEEVRMLVELFYLPYHHGPQAQRLLEHFRWLQANSLSVGVPAAAPDACGGTRWRGRAQSFQLLCAQICRLHSRLVSSASRALLYDLHGYLWDIRNVLLAASAFVLWLDGHLLCDPDPKGTWGSCFGWCQSITAPILLAGDAEPWARRGGLFGELQALLPVGNSCDLFYHPPPLFPSSQLYLLHPLLPLDKAELYRMCQESLDCDPKVAEILAAHPDILGDRLLGSFLSLSPEYTFVLEDEGGPCGYAAGALCAESFLQQRDSNWLPATRHKYPRDLGTGTPAPGQDVLEEALLFFHTEPLAVPLPVLRRFPSLVQLGTAPRVLDVGASRSLAICLLSALRANGSRGVFCQVSATDQQQLSFYSRLGFVALPVAWDSSPGTRLLGRLL